MTFFLKYDVVSPKKIWGHLQTPLFTYKITHLAPLWVVSETKCLATSSFKKTDGLSFIHNLALLTQIFE